MEYLQQKLQDWEEWFYIHEKPRIKIWSEVWQQSYATSERRMQQQIICDLAQQVQEWTVWYNDHQVSTQEEKRYAKPRREQ
eukprot:5494220-Alexandrium_andersonii.AAC.1